MLVPYVALVFGHFHGMLNIGGSNHLIVIRLAFLLLKLFLVQFLWKDYDW